jgi:hypothetical protein
MEFAQAEDILGTKVVLDESPVLGLVLRDDREVVVKQGAALGRFPLTHIASAALPEHRLGHEQASRGVNRALTPSVR